MDTIDISAQIVELEEEYAKKPYDKNLIMGLIDVYQDNSMWDKLVEMLKRLVDLETDESSKAGFFYTIGQVYHYELDDELNAVDYYNRALDSNNMLQGAFHNILNMLNKSENWYLLERNIRRMISRLEKSSEPHRDALFNLWYDLGDIIHKHKKDVVSCVEAFRKALEYSPNDTQVKRELAAIYVEYGETFMDDAITLCSDIRHRNPLDTENLITLFNLYQKSSDHDKSWCIASALTALDVKNKFISDYHKLYNPGGLTKFRNNPNPDVFEDLIWYYKGDEYINKLMIFLSTAMADVFSTTWKKTGLNPSNAVENSPDAPAFVRIFNYVSDILISTPVKLFIEPERDIDMTTAIVKEDNGTLTPVIVAGHGVLSGYSEKELIFLISRELFYFQPQRFIFRVLGSLSELYGLLLASVKFSNPKLEIEGDEAAINRTVNTLDRMLSDNLQDILVKIVNSLLSHVGLPSFLNYIYRIEASSLHAAHSMINDPVVSLKMIDKLDSTVINKAQFKEILISFITGEQYFEFRKTTGISIV